MTTPDSKITVIMATARGDHPMLDRPDVGIFDPFVESLERQTFREFDVVVVDALHGIGSQDRALPLKRLEARTGIRVKHVPFPDSPWYRAGYLAISAPKNHGIVHANGQLVVTIDDCCEFGTDYLARFWAAHEKGLLATSALHYYRGGHFKMSAGREACCPRQRPFGWPGGGFGYTSFRLADVLRINGYDEGYDGSKCLEDADFSERMTMLGRRHRLERGHVVIEHEHEDVSPDAWSVPPPPPKGDRSIKCNGIHDQIVKARHGDDRLQANRRKYTDEEWSRFGPPCAYYAGVAQSGPHAGQGLCSTAKLPCNWLRTSGDADSGNWLGADPNWEKVRDWLPVFDLADRWRQRRRDEGRSEEIPR